MLLLLDIRANKSQTSNRYICHPERTAYQRWKVNKKTELRGG